MPLHDKGDIVKAIGFMTIYYGYLEESLDNLFEIVAEYHPELNDKKHLRFSDKAKHLRKQLVQAFTPDCPSTYEKHRVRKLLLRCQDLAKDRNEIIHSAIYGGAVDVAILNSKKTGERAISSVEVSDLANAIFDCSSGVQSLEFVVRRMTQ